MKATEVIPPTFNTSVRLADLVVNAERGTSTSISDKNIKSFFINIFSKACVGFIVTPSCLQYLLVLSTEHKYKQGHRGLDNSFEGTLQKNLSLSRIDTLVYQPLFLEK